METTVDTIRQVEHGRKAERRRPISIHVAAGDALIAAGARLRRGSEPVAEPQDREGTMSRAWCCLLGTLIVGIGIGLVGGLLGSALFLPRPSEPAASVRSYVDGYAHSDGQRIWASYSLAAHERLTQHGQTEATTVAFYDWLKTRPGKVERVVYLGGYRTPDHGAYLYLVAGRRDDGSAFANTWYFITDAEGQIDTVL